MLHEIIEKGYNTTMHKASANLHRWLKTWAKLPELRFVATLQRRFPRAGFYLVGGMVRDIALGRPSKDFDVVVTGVPARRLEAALGQLGSVGLVGKTFGVLKFVPRGNTGNAPIDVALPRREHAFGTGGYRDVEVQSDPKLPIEDDLARRDFTINAMALRLSSLRTISPKGRGTKGEGDLQPTTYNLQPHVVDPFGGLDDLAKKTIRCVGNPSERFQEDYSRMPRAIRFACQLDFAIEPTTWAAIERNIQHLTDERDGNRVVPAEVIAKELVKAVVAQPVRAMEMMDRCGAVKLLMPELLTMKGCPQPPQFHTEGDVWTHTVVALGKLSSKEFRKEFKIKNTKGFIPKPFLPLTKGEVAGVKGHVDMSSKFEIPAELVWATLFHDVGKPSTLTITDRIRTNGHDIKGARMFREIAERLKLSSAGLNVAVVEELIAKHLIATHAKKTQMKETTIEKYFFNPAFPGQQLLQLTFVDISATIAPSGRPDFAAYRQLKQRVTTLRRRLKSRRVLPAPLVDGHQIMALLKIPPGPLIKRVKEFLREQQLAGKIKTRAQAKTAVQKKFGRKTPPQSSP